MAVQLDVLCFARKGTERPQCNGDLFAPFREEIDEAFICGT